MIIAGKLDWISVLMDRFGKDAKVLDILSNR